MNGKVLRFALLVIGLSVATALVVSCHKLADTPHTDSGKLDTGSIFKSPRITKVDFHVLLNDVAVLSNNNVWGVGYNGKDGEELFRSSDGGLGWTRVILPGGLSAQSLHAIFFADDLHGWAVGDSGRGLHTVDGGLTWSNLQLPTGHELTEVHFFNAQVGYVSARLSSGCEIWATRDGGADWFLSYRDDEAGQVFEMATLNDQVALVAVNDSTLIRTGDGGKTWRQVVMAKAGASGVFFNVNGTAWLVGKNGTIYYSTNTGLTWSEPSALPASASNESWSSVQFYDENEGIILSDNGRLLVTSDGGIVWKEPPASEKLDCWGVRLNKNTGILFGRNIYRIEKTP